jgi:hypothetical protein
MDIKSVGARLPEEPGLGQAVTTQKRQYETRSPLEEGDRVPYASCLRRIGDSITRAPWLNVMYIPGQRSQAAR